MNKRKVEPSHNQIVDATQVTDTQKPMKAMAVYDHQTSGQEMELESLGD